MHSSLRFAVLHNLHFRILQFSKLHTTLLIMWQAWYSKILEQEKSVCQNWSVSTLNMVSIAWFFWIDVDLPVGCINFSKKGAFIGGNEIFTTRDLQRMLNEHLYRTMDRSLLFVPVFNYRSTGQRRSENMAWYIRASVRRFVMRKDTLVSGYEVKKVWEGGLKQPSISKRYWWRRSISNSILAWVPSCTT